MKTEILSFATQNYVNVIMFFTFSFLGWVLETLDIRYEKGVWENRGFVHGPFCIIYGFGAMIGYIILQPFTHNYVLLYIMGALSATAFELLTAFVMKKLLGTVWWDYSEKPFNYKGVICLESTFAWGFVAVLVLGFLHAKLFEVLSRIPTKIGMFLAATLLMGYMLDFIISMNTARKQKAQLEETNSDFVCN